MKRAAVFLIAASLVLASAAEDPTKCPPAKCTKDFNPVCTAANNTFSNACLAEACGGVVACQGQCPCPSTKASGHEGDCDARPCPLIYRPVCSTGNVSYASECQMEACKGTKACDGECPCTAEPDDRSLCLPTHCTADFVPVCSTKNNTYDNACLAQACFASIQCQGECPCSEETIEQCDDRPCPLNLRPVCATNGRSYDNECFMESCGATKECDGECPCSSQAGSSGSSTGGSTSGGAGEPPAVNEPADPSLCPPAKCTKEYVPVCSLKNNQYANSCLAEACGAEIACDGPCPCSDTGMGGA